MTSVWVAKSQNKLLKPFQNKEKVNYINPVNPKTDFKRNKKGNTSKNSRNPKTKENQDRRTARLKYKFCSHCETYPSNHIYSECKRKPYCTVCGLHHIRGQSSRCRESPRWYPEEVTEKEDYKWKDKEQYLFKPTRGRTTRNKKRVQHVDEEERSQEEIETNSGDENKDIEGDSQPIHSMYFQRVSQVRGNSKSTKPQGSRTSHETENRDHSHRCFYSRSRNKSSVENFSNKEKSVTPSRKPGNKSTASFTKFYISADGLPLLPGKNFQ